MFRQRSWIKQSRSIIWRSRVVILIMCQRIVCWCIMRVRILMEKKEDLRIRERLRVYRLHHREIMKQNKVFLMWMQMEMPENDMQMLLRWLITL